MTCPACDRAKTHPRTGIYQSGCYGCEVRAIAQSPKHIREQAYAQQPDDWRAQFKADVATEYRRINGATA
ncbi:MAG TPA: hypothetical protein VLF15_01740 [Pseudoxanthomonas sp.]|nr:hypothetical protein [Pseudoxanthomonas sp.]